MLLSIQTLVEKSGIFTNNITFEALGTKTPKSLTKRENVLKREDSTSMEFNESDPLCYTSKESDAQILFNKGVSIFMLVMSFLFIYLMFLLVDEGITGDDDIVALVVSGI